MNTLSFDDYKALAKKTKNVAIFRELSLEVSPPELYELLSTYFPAGQLLESAINSESGRFSYLFFSPIAEFKASLTQITVKKGTQIEQYSADKPFEILRNLISNLNYVTAAEKTEYINAAVGYVTYDAVRFFEKIPDRHFENTIPEIAFNFYEISLAYDHQEKNLLISVIAETKDNLESCYQEANRKIEAMIKIAERSPSLKKRVDAEGGGEICNTSLLTSLYKGRNYETDISDEHFEDLVTKAKEHVTCGDIFQVVLSRKFTSHYSTTPFEIYKNLRRENPSPYMFYLNFFDNVILGASPEKMMSVKNNEVQINPIAGTYRNNENRNSAEIEEILLKDKKETAEHIMLVDLARNDIGAVSEPGTVKVKEYCVIKHYPNVSHITSVVTGQLKKNADAFDALTATFPAGTLSGAPKIRAMEIIDNLESSRRGLYGGAICRLDFAGNFDSCIAIRMAVLKDGVATMRAGAGIVYDSIPSSEAQETRQKIKSVMEAVNAVTPPSLPSPARGEGA